MTNKQDKTTYHHGDLRSSLVSNANDMIKDGGIDSLSLRKLADKVGVSRSAPYHHFKDKNDLLCAIAEEGFKHWRSTDLKIIEQKELSPKEKYRRMIRSYIVEATKNPELYDLMFGRTIWKQNTATQDLNTIAYQNFQYHVEITKLWQQHNLLPAEEDTLRLAKVTWATMHGLAKLLTDGIYADQSHIDEMCETAVNLFMRSTA